MIKSILSLLLFFSVSIGFSQEWNSNFNEVKQIALKENKKIVLVFQGSDWCAPCIKLEKEIWSTDEFKSFSRENFVLIKADFPRKKKNKLSKEQQEENKNLMEKYNKKGYFPFVVVLDKDAKVLGETGYIKATPKEYIKLLTSF